MTAQQLVQGERSEYEKIRAANINKDKEELLQTLQRDWKAFKESEGLVTGGESQKGATKLKALERKAGSTRKSSVSNDVKVKKNRPAGLVTNKSVKGSRAVMVNCQEEEEAGAAPFTEGEDILVHLEDGLIYLGVVVEVEEEQGQCLVHFGDGTERWSTFNQLQRLGEISDDECTPTSITERPEPVDSEEESSEIKIDSQASGKSEQSVEIPTGDKRFSCSSCDYFCSTATNLRIHTRVHTGEKPYSCTKCDYSCSQSSSLSRHMSVHNGEKPFSCAQCPYRCSHKQHLERHILGVHSGEEKSYSCTKCNYSCSRSDHFTAHMKLHTERPEPVDSEEESSEIKIDSQASGKSEQSVEIPTGDKRFSCSSCDYFCSTATNLRIHTRVHTGEKPYSCTKCDYTCAHSYSLTYHTRRIHPCEKPYRCKKCDYSCSHADDLKKHKRIHTGENSYSCTKCDYSCFSSTYLKVHMRVHTGEKPYSCTKCEYSCSTSKYLKIHMRVHTGEKPYSCTKCDYSCSQSSSLSRHMRVHNGAKPFSCAQCPYRCSHKHILKRHILGVHSGEEKSYICTKCNYSSSRSDHFTAHMKLHTGEKNHACTHCDYSTSYKSAIKRHMRKHH